MGKWSDGLRKGGSFVSLKAPCDVTVEILDIQKVENKPEFEPKAKDGTRQGFCFEFTTDKGLFSVGSYVLQRALQEAGVDIGDKIRIQHTGKGIYIVNKVTA